MAGGVDLPGDIIEEILSYLPVKSLLRFKSVSKSWYATISNASFAGAHIRKNSPRFLIGQRNYGFLIEQIIDGCPIRKRNRGHYDESVLIEFKKDWQIQESFPLDHRLNFPESYSALCYGDGLTVGYLLYYSKWSTFINDPFVYAVWNPSTRILLKFQCPYDSMINKAFNSWKNHGLFGLGYDSVMNEYKFVICNGAQYTIFYCRNKRWSEIKNVEGFTFTMPLKDVGMYFSYNYGFFSKSNGDFYWYYIHKQSIGTCYIEVICFDSKEEKLKRLPDWPFQTPAEGYHKFFSRIVASEEGNLALFYRVTPKEDEDNCDAKILVLKSGDGGEYSWTTFLDGIPKLPSGYTKIYPLYLAVKDEIVILTAHRKNERQDYLLVYNMRDKTFIGSHNDSYHPYKLSLYPYHPDIMTPFTDNLFFSSPENGGENGGEWIQECIL